MITLNLSSQELVHLRNLLSVKVSLLQEDTISSLLTKTYLEDEASVKSFSEDDLVEKILDACYKNGIPTSYDNNSKIDFIVMPVISSIGVVQEGEIKYISEPDET